MNTGSSVPVVARGARHELLAVGVDQVVDEPAVFLRIEKPLFQGIGLSAMFERLVEQPVSVINLGENEMKLLTFSWSQTFLQ
jgi:hypothetical protein